MIQWCSCNGIQKDDHWSNEISQQLRIITCSCCCFVVGLSTVCWTWLEPVVDGFRTVCLVFGPSVCLDLCPFWSFVWYVPCGYWTFWCSWLSVFLDCFWVHGIYTWNWWWNNTFVINKVWNLSQWRSQPGTVALRLNGIRWAFSLLIMVEFYIRNIVNILGTTEPSAENYISVRSVFTDDLWMTPQDPGFCREQKSMLLGCCMFLGWYLGW